MEGGTLGLALHPDFKNNQKIYIYQTNLELEFFQNKVFSFTVNGDALTDKQVIIDALKNNYVIISAFQVHHGMMVHLDS